jgi:hypothetical protein
MLMSTDSHQSFTIVAKDELGRHFPDRQLVSTIVGAIIWPRLAKALNIKSY